MRKLFMVLALVLSASSLSISVSEAAGVAPLNKADTLGEPGAEEEPVVALPLEVQRQRLIEHVDHVLGAETQRARLRAHADLLEDVDELSHALRRAVASRDEDPIIRSVAIWALGERGTPHACLSARQAANDPDNALYQLSLAIARGRCGDTADLRAVLSQGTDFTRPRAAVALGMLEDKAALATVQSLAERARGTEHEDAYVLARGLYGDAATTPELLVLLNDRAQHLHAAIALARMGYDYVVFDLQAATRSPESFLRWGAAKVLTSKKLPGSCEVLGELTHDTDARVVELSSGVMNRWRDEAETHWLREGFNMDHFSPRAYCP